MSVLEQPERIRTDITRQQANADTQRVATQHQRGLIDTALKKCDWEAQRRAEAYAAEVTSLDDLKGYRAEISSRRESLLSAHAACQRQLEAIGAAVQLVDALTEFCAGVRQRLQTFEEAEKRQAIEALNLQVSWTPGQPFVIEGSIPVGQMADIPANAVPVNCIIHGGGPNSCMTVMTTLHKNACD